MKHPAPYTPSLLPLFREILRETVGEGATVLDPFAGTGRIHELWPEFQTVGIEIEAEWAALSDRTQQGDATHLPFDDGSFDAIVTSPTYGNRMADHHKATDSSKRITYTHVLGRELHENNTGQQQWGEKYRSLHRAAWAEAARVLRPAGVFVINVSNHIRRGEEVDVTAWHIEAMQHLGFTLLHHHLVPTPRMRFGANGAARVSHESVLVFSIQPDSKEKK